MIFSVCSFNYTVLNPIASYKHSLGYNRGMLTTVNFCLKFRSRYFSANKIVNSPSLNSSQVFKHVMSFSATLGLAEDFENTFFTKNGLADTCY